MNKHKSNSKSRWIGSWERSRCTDLLLCPPKVIPKLPRERWFHEEMNWNWDGLNWWRWVNCKRREWVSLAGSDQVGSIVTLRNWDPRPPNGGAVTGAGGGGGGSTDRWLGWGLSGGVHGTVLLSELYIIIIIPFRLGPTELELLTVDSRSPPPPGPTLPNNCISLLIHEFKTNL